RAAALTSRLPGGGDFDSLGVRLTTSAGRVQESLAVQAVGGDYFRALGVVPTSGRGIAVADERQRAPVAVVNQRLVDRYWQGRSPLGQTIEIIDLGTVTVVGVVPDVRAAALRDELQPLFYLPWSVGASPPRQLYLLARADGEAAALAP